VTVGGRFVTIAGSWRRGSLTEQTLHLAEGVAAERYGVRHDRLRIQEFPHYDADLEASDLSAVVRRGRERVRAADVLLICTPEYNGAPPGSLQNALDWLSRPWLDSPLTGKRVATLSSAPGHRGAERGHRRLREMLEIIGAELVGPALCVCAADRLHDAMAAGPGAPAFLHDVRGLLDQLFGAPRPPVSSPCAAGEYPGLPGSSTHRTPVRAAASTHERRFP